MADGSDNTAGKGLSLSPEVMKRVAQELGSAELDSRLPAGGSKSLVTEGQSPITQAFNKLGEGGSALPTTLPFLGTSPVSYTQYRGNDGLSHQDGKRGIEYKIEGTDFRLMAGSYIPKQEGSGIEHWTAGVAWTPINMDGLKMGPMLGDVAQSDMREGAARPFKRIGLSAGLYVTNADDSKGGVFGKVETDPANGGKPKVFIGYKMPFNGQ